MENEKDLFEFIDNDIYSSAEKSTAFEDIVSDSHSKGKHYAKKKRGNRFTKWWLGLRKKEKALLITIASLVLVFAIVIGVLLKMFDYNYNNITKNPEDLGFENIINEKIVNVALFGIDTRKIDSFEGLSDSIMILSINTETKKVKVISVMRDSLVPITYNGKTSYAKINSAYNRGGPELAIKTINTIFGLDISEYATVNFYGMVDIIDAVGGIDVTLTKAELNVYFYENGVKQNGGLNGCIGEICSHLKVDPVKYYINAPGKHHLNGIQAVSYARIRKAPNFEGTNDDYGRTDRQRYVMEQLFNKAVTLNKSEYVKLAKALAPCSETSLSISEILGLAVNVLLESPKFEQSRVPLVEYQMNSKYISRIGSCVYYDLDYAKKIIHAFIYDDIDPETYMETNGIERNDWYGNNTSNNNKPSSSSKNEGTVTSSKPTSSKNDNSKLEVSSSEDTTTSEDITSSEVTSTEPETGENSDNQSGSSSGNNSGGEETDNSSSDSSEGSSSVVMGESNPTS